MEVAAQDLELDGDKWAVAYAQLRATSSKSSSAYIAVFLYNYIPRGGATLGHTRSNDLAGRSTALALALPIALLW